MPLSEIEQKEKIEIQIQSTILIALFKSTVEQSTTMTGKYNRKPKEIFQRWQRLGFKLLDSLEKETIVDPESMDNITDCYHNMNLEFKRTATEKYLNSKK